MSQNPFSGGRFFPCGERRRQVDGKLAIPTDMDVEILQRSFFVPSPSAETDI
jgi:hypothetical protein